MTDTTFHRPVSLDDIAETAHPVHVEATADECAYLAGRLGLEGVESLTADLTLSLRTDQTGEMVEVSGRMTAEIDQVCVVSLETFRSRLETEIEGICVPESATEDFDSAVEGEDDENPDILIEIRDNAIDVGEMLAQQLSLELDPFPRKPGVVFEGYSAGSNSDAEEEDSPFAVLKKLKSNPG